MTKPPCCPSCQAPRPAPLDGVESITCACGWVQVFSVDMAPIRALRGLKAEVNAVLGLAERELREVIGNTNMSVLLHWRDRAAQVLAKAESSHDGDSDAHLAPHAVQEVRRLREESDTADASLARLQAEQARLREALQRIADCDWTIGRGDRMDPVREIARAALSLTEGKPSR